MLAIKNILLKARLLFFIPQNIKIVAHNQAIQLMPQIPRIVKENVVICSAIVQAASF
jgi:hypothetical protein